MPKKESIQALKDNMATAKERQKILFNVIARVGMDGDVLGEFAKAMSSLNGLQTFNEVNPPMPPVTSNTAISAPQSANPIPSTNQGTILS